MEDKAIIILEDFVKKWPDLCNVHGDFMRKGFYGFYRTLKDAYLVPPQRDQIVENNLFIMRVCDILTSAKDKDETFQERIADLSIKSAEKGLDCSTLMKSLSLALKEKIISLKHWLLLFLYMYHFLVEGALREQLKLILFSLIVVNKSIETRKTRQGGKAEFKDFSQSPAVATQIEIKEITEVKSLTEIKQLDMLQLGEIWKIIKRNQEKIVHKTITSMCNLNLRNTIAHGKFKIDVQKKRVLIEKNKFLTFNQLQRELEKLYKLIFLIDTGAVITVIRPYL